VFEHVVSRPPQHAQVSGTKPELLARLTGNAPPLKKPRAAAAPEPPSAPVAGVPANLLAITETSRLKRELKAGVLTLARMVDDDWHDGYEEQGEHLGTYVLSWEAPLQAVLTICTTPGASCAALARCNDVLVALADSWEDIKGVPMRGSVEDSVGDGAPLDLSGHGAGKLDSLQGMQRSSAMEVAWMTLLRCAAATPAERVSDADALRWVKDASDFGHASVALVTDQDERLEECVIDAEDEAGEGEEPQESEELRAMREWCSDASRARLLALLGSTAQLEALPTRKVAHKGYRCIDRRFDGPKNRRTRDFDSFY
jgi:hypothetical protein